MYTENIGRDRNKAERSASYRGYTQMQNYSQNRTQNNCCTLSAESNRSSDDNHSSDMRFPSLAMAYVECQTWQNIYEADVGISRGTIFCDLDKPWGVAAFAAGYCKRNGGCK